MEQFCSNCAWKYWERLIGGACKSFDHRDGRGSWQRCQNHCLCQNPSTWLVARRLAGTSSIWQRKQTAVSRGWRSLSKWDFLYLFSRSWPSRERQMIRKNQLRRCWEKYVLCAVKEMYACLRWFQRHDEHCKGGYIKIESIFKLINCVCRIRLFQSYLAVILTKVKMSMAEKKIEKQHFHASNKYFLGREIAWRYMRFVSPGIYAVSEINIQLYPSVKTEAYRHMGRLEL